MKQMNIKGINTSRIQLYVEEINTRSTILFSLLNISSNFHLGLSIIMSLSKRPTIKYTM